ncbi:MAG: M3 family oligoendopeptidase [Clostridia bacterium]|nr:M3 family oligoendopeptidase [Clostridia bacterium]
MEKFKDIEYKRPDINELKKQCRLYIKKLRSAKSAEEADAAFLAMNGSQKHFFSMVSIAHIRNTMNMKDEFYDAEKKFFDVNLPKLMPLVKKLNKTLAESPYRKDLEKTYGDHYFKSLENSIRLMKLSIIKPSVEESLLGTEYSKVAAAASTEFNGKQCNFYGLLKEMQSDDIETRRAALKAWADLYESISGKLDEIYGKLIKKRVTIAKRLGFKSYIDYAYLARERFDYGPEDVAAFREAVRKYITPLCDKFYREQAGRLGLEKLNWCDEAVIFPDGNAIPQGTPEELTDKALEMYRHMSPETGEFFSFMREYELYDFVTRENKHMGGYCTMIHEFKAPFIFSNFNGTAADVDVLTHEAGHAFEYYYSSRRLPIDDICTGTSEINEIHSMTMEHFAYPYMESFFGDKADKYRFGHFCEAVKTIPYLVSVDEFQHRVYGNPGSTPAMWRQYWKEIEQKYMPWRHYDGIEFLENGGFWMQKQHIFLYPFYYVDYALAQMGALYLYKLNEETGEGFRRYIELCGLGGKYGYFETLDKAGIPRPLLEDTVKAVAEFAEAQAELLKGKVKA